jgi:hypothetical protein
MSGSGQNVGSIDAYWTSKLSIYGKQSLHETFKCLLNHCNPLQRCDIRRANLYNLR